MSYADDFIENIIDFDGFDENGGRTPRGYDREAAYRRRARAARLLRQRRFRKFFRTDGRTPKRLTAEGEWMPLDKMTRAHMRNIVSRNRSARPLMGTIMEAPEGETPESRLGERFAGVGSWEEAMRIMFADEVRRRRDRGIRW